MKKQIINAKTGEVEVVDMTAEEEAARRAEWDAAQAAQQIVDAETARVESFTSSADFQDLETRLKTATPAQINSWVDNNVTSIATVRPVLKAIIKLLIKLYARS
jgi:hypothetical protein